MRLEKLAFAILYKHRNVPQSEAKAAWSVWTMRGTWMALEFDAHYLKCCELCGCDVTGHA